ncbi:MAG: RluA family pseudouridine synthase [Bacteroidetes bacterium]|nr:MAG: RluA family pseudouridine synthase [Bacteroidota bacterium]
MSLKLKLPPRLDAIILHEDEHLIIVNKPVGMSSLDDKESRSLQDMARSYNEELRLCHRLDKNTSGVLVIAKSAEMYREMAIKFEKRLVKKQYITLAGGIHRYENLEIDLPLLISTNRKVSVNHRQGKPALTYVTTEEVFRSHTLLRCEPVSGRMHQIRAHLSAMGCPISGDLLYGGKDILLSELKRRYKPSGRDREEQPLNHGYLLHSQKISFSHPATGEELVCTAELPENFAATLKVLRKYDV